MSTFIISTTSYAEMDTQRVERTNSDKFLGAVAFLSSYYSLILLMTGCLCNPLSFCVLSRRAFRDSAMSVYLRFLTVSDTTALLLGLLRFFMLSTFEVNDLRDTLEACRVHVWLVDISLYSSSWTLVVVTLERVVSIVWPHKVKIICTKSTSKLILVIVVVVWAVILSNHFVLFGHLTVASPATNDTLTRHCTIVYNREFSSKVYWLFDGINFALLPTCFLVVSNVVIAKGVIKSRKRVEKTSAASRDINRSAQSPCVNVINRTELERFGPQTAVSSHSPDSDIPKLCQKPRMSESVVALNSETISGRETDFKESREVEEGIKGEVTGATVSASDHRQLSQSMASHSGQMSEERQDGTGYYYARSDSKCGPKTRVAQDKHGSVQNNIKADGQLDSKKDKKKTTAKPLKSSKETSLTLTLVAINMCYVVCTFPICAFEVGPHYQTAAGMGSYGEGISKLLLMLAYTNNAMNFFLYCLTGTRFRAELKAMVTEVFICCRTSTRHTW